LINEYDRAYASWLASGSRNWNYSAASSAESELKELNEHTRKVARLQQQLTEVERSPPSVLQPLPTSKDLALQILFYLNMPALFRTLSSMSFTAQQMLVPSDELEKNSRRIIRHELVWLLQFVQEERIIR